MRRLLTTRRHVALDVADAYLDGWNRLRREVEAAGGRAWIFRGAGHEDRFIEFIEWSDDSPGPLTSERAAAAATELDALAAPAAADEWEELR